MRSKFILAFTLIALLLSACGLPGLAHIAGPAAVSLSQNLYVVPANATSTPTPFQPLPPTPTFFPTEMVLAPTQPPLKIKSKPLTSFPGPSEYSDAPIPPAAEPIDQPDGQVNILIMGSDQRRGDVGFRTDTMILLTVNPNRRTVSLVSFPRDLYVYIPGWKMQRINTAMAHGGFDATQLTLAYNMGIKPDHYILINFWSFVNLIDSLGGIDVDVATSLTDTMGSQWVTIPPGVTHMNGELALWYARSRMTTNDFERNRRQQEVLSGVIKSLLSLYSITQASKLFKTYSESVETDLKFSDILSLLPLAAKISDTASINHYYVGRDQVTSWITPGGAMVLLPNREAVLDVMREAIKGR